MSKRLKLAEVDRLLEVLDNSRLGPPPRAEIDALHQAYVHARRFEERARVIYGVAIIALLALWIGAGFVRGTLDIATWMNPVMMVLVALNLVALTAISAWLPVLKRREQVITLLEYFEADLTPVDRLYARKTAPSNVLSAIEALENAKDPAELGPAYALVERWSHKAHGLDFDGLYVAFLWLVGLVVALSGDHLGLPDFLRGIALGVVAVLAIQYYLRTQDERGVRRRAEDALGRWRHLVPQMRELPR